MKSSCYIENAYERALNYENLPLCMCNEQDLYYSVNSRILNNGNKLEIIKMSRNSITYNNLIPNTVRK